MLNTIKRYRSYERVKGPLTYNQDGLASAHYCDFIKDQKFHRAYQAGKATGSWGKSDIHWRAMMACWAAEQVKHLPGDLIECGVNKGGLARTVIEYIDLTSLNKKFYLLDTFCGLADDYTSEEEIRILKQSQRKYPDCYEEVKATFSSFETTRIIKGAVPETLEQVDADQICYASIDMNCALPEIEATKFIWPKLVTGGIILLDDYGWKGHEAQKAAFNELDKELGLNILPLPTGQALIIKR